MYLGSNFHHFWARCGGRALHPDDEYVLGRQTLFTKEVLPCPFDGPLETARVIICLANPSYEKVEDKVGLNQQILAMRSGEEKLPNLFMDFYRRITGPIDLAEECMRKLVAVVNVCPYGSANMDEGMASLAAGLPSVWQAQQYLRDVLIPRAQTGNIYLLMLRKHQLWGVTKGLEQDGNFRVVRGRERNGVMSSALGQEIRNWLIHKGHITNQDGCESRGNENS